MKIRRLNPPLHLLRTFTTVVRFGGISRAAADLQLTQSAVTKQVQELERWLEVSLFTRQAKRLEVTPAGARYERAIRPLLEQIEAATLGLIGASVEGGALNVAAMPTFSAKWLIPRLPDFHRRHPDVHINFVPYVRGFEGLDANIDCAVLFGDGKWPGAEAVYLEGREVVLVAGSEASRAIRDLQDVRAFPLLRHVATPQDWPRWQEIHQLAGLQTLAGPQFDSYQAMIQAVIAGIGIALIPRCLILDELALRQLAAPLDGKPGGGYLGDCGYWFCFRQEQQQTTSLRLFRDWLVSQVDY